MNMNSSNRDAAESASESTFETSSGFGEDFYKRMLMYLRKVTEKFQENSSSSEQ